MALRAHSQTSGWSLTAQDPFNNVARTCVEALAAALGHTQSLHTNALDEAIALPTDFSARIARNTQIYLQAGDRDHEGRRSVGRLLLRGAPHARAHAQAWQLIEEVEELGGMAKAIETGIAEDAHRRGGRAQAGADRLREGSDRRGQYVPAASTRRRFDVLEIDNAGGARSRRLRGWRSSSATAIRGRPCRQRLPALTELRSRGERQSAGTGRRCGARARPRWARFPLRSRRSSGRYQAVTRTISGVYSARALATRSSRRARRDGRANSLRRKGAGLASSSPRWARTVMIAAPR